MTALLAMTAGWAMALTGQVTGVQPPRDPLPIVPEAGSPALVLTDPFLGPFSVTEPSRLALTPLLDGRIQRQEWDALGLAGGQSPVAFQWQPGALFAAGVVPMGQDSVWSFDLNGDGWLVGDDNLQVRVSLVNGQPRVTTSRLDGTGRDGPLWTSAELVEAGALVAGGPISGTAEAIQRSFEWSATPPVGAAAAIGLMADAASPTPAAWVFEARILPVNLVAVREGKSIGVRADLIPANAEPKAAFIPRPTSLVSLRLERNQGMPAGLDWEPSYEVRQVMPGRRVDTRLSFKNPTDVPLQRLALWTDGLGNPFTKSVEMPFPAFDRKKRATVTYSSEVSLGASLGWRVLRGLVTTDDGGLIQLFSSYEVAPLVSLSVALPNDLNVIPESRIVRGQISVKSNSRYRVDGQITITVPPSWTAVKGNAKGFSIYSRYGTARVGLELIAPQRASGLIPITVTAKMGSEISEQTVYLPIKG